MSYQKEKFKKNITTLSNENNAHNIYEITCIKNDIFTLKDQKEIFQEAELAASCIIVPKIGDIVLCIEHDNQLYITFVIKSYSLEPKEYNLKGIVKAGLDESYIKIDPQSINLQTNKINLVSQVISTLANIGKWIINGISIKAESIHQKTQNHNIECNQTLNISAKNKKTIIKELDSQVADITIQNSKQINITTDKLNINS